jgi:PTH1 family peptidyl-tRNA hydrolase
LRIIFGIGNPGRSYAANRHNAGFLALDFIASEKRIEFSPSVGSYFSSEGLWGGDKYMLVKPATFVNKSGIAAKEIIEKYNLQVEDFLVVCDDINLNLGALRVRLSGGDGGHNGLASLIYHLNSNNFPRIRIGVGQSPEKNSLADFVLSDFNEIEIQNLHPVYEKTILLIEEFVKGGSKAMLDLNSKLNPGTKENKQNE